MDDEIIIVGAGPAGSAAAISFALKGRRVLLMDQSAFPRGKPCGDAVAPSGVGLLYGLGLKEKIRQAGFQTVQAVRLVSPDRRDLRIRFRPADPDLAEMIAPRRVLDALLKDHAVESGAEFIQAKATAIVTRNGRVAGVRAVTGGATREFRCRLLIGADGSGSKIARLLGEEARDPEDAVTIRGYFPNVHMDPGTAEIHLLRELWPGYAWIFLAGGHTANVGLGLSIDRYRKMKKSLKTILSDFIHSPGLRERFDSSFDMPVLAASMMKLYSPNRTRRTFDGALLIGDAAALVNPLNGGGIVNAMMSGIIAAGIADRALAENDVSRKRLREYETALWNAMGRELALSYRIKKMSSSPAVMETVMKFILANRKVIALAGRYYRDVKFRAE